ncbi:MAG: helix-turn-helix transcriptional regulator [Bdellovibrionota bacterium]
MSDHRPPYLQKAIDQGGEELGQALKTARKRRGITLVEMAAKIGVTRRTLTRLEKGDTAVNLAVLLACLTVYGLLNQLTASVLPNKDPQGQKKID